VRERHAQCHRLLRSEAAQALFPRQQMGAHDDIVIASDEVKHLCWWNGRQAVENAACLTTSNSVGRSETANQRRMPGFSQEQVSNIGEQRGEIHALDEFQAPDKRQQADKGWYKVDPQPISHGRQGLVSDRAYPIHGAPEQKRQFLSARGSGELDNGGLANVAIAVRGQEAEQLNARGAVWDIARKGRSHPGPISCGSDHPSGRTHPADRIVESGQRLRWHFREQAMDRLVGSGRNFHGDRSGRPGADRLPELGEGRH